MKVLLAGFFLAISVVYPMEVTLACLISAINICRLSWPAYEIKSGIKI